MGLGEDLEQVFIHLFWVVRIKACASKGCINTFEDSAVIFFLLEISLNGLVQMIEHPPMYEGVQ